MNKLFLALVMCWSFATIAQEAVQEPIDQEQAVPEQTSPQQPTENTAPRNSAAIGEANINLRTIVTGNQEQPRVMYILPWQSPLSPELEMEMLGSEADSVFGHLERDELQRHLEAAGEFDAAQ